MWPLSESLFSCDKRDSLNDHLYLPETRYRSQKTAKQKTNPNKPIVNCGHMSMDAPNGHKGESIAKPPNCIQGNPGDVCAAVGTSKSGFKYLLEAYAIISNDR